MQEQSISSDSNNFHWLDIVEIISVIGSIGGTVASVVSQQAAFASIPLSLSVSLNLANRRRLLNLAAQENQRAIASLAQQSRDERTNLESISKQLTQVQQLTSDLSRDTKELHENTENLEEKQKQIEELVGNLSEITNLTQAIRTNPNSPQSYYERALKALRLGDKQGAIEDYTEAIRLDPSYANAYYNRGLLSSQVGDRKRAVQDLRTAAKFYFEQGDLPSYQKARDMSNNIHDLSSKSKGETSETLVPAGLFS